MQQTDVVFEGWEGTVEFFFFDSSLFPAFASFKYFFFRLGTLAAPDSRRLRDFCQGTLPFLPSLLFSLPFQIKLLSHSPPLPISDNGAEREKKMSRQNYCVTSPLPHEQPRVRGYSLNLNRRIFFKTSSLALFCCYGGKGKGEV